jgi:hypothetical protein
MVLLELADGGFEGAFAAGGLQEKFGDNVRVITARIAGDQPGFQRNVDLKIRSIRLRCLGIARVKQQNQQANRSLPRCSPRTVPPPGGQGWSTEGLHAPARKSINLI